MSIEHIHPISREKRQDVTSLNVVARMHASV